MNIVQVFETNGDYYNVTVVDGSKEFEYSRRTDKNKKLEEIFIKYTNMHIKLRGQSQSFDNNLKQTIYTWVFY